MYSVDELLEEARTDTGHSDFGEPTYEPPIRRLVQDLNGDTLNEFGQRFFRRQAIKELSRRLRLVDFFTDHPEIEDVELPPIVMITGHARTGTTLLHNLMALDPLARPMLRWEFVEPLPPPERATRDSDPRIEKVQAQIEQIRGTELERLHWVNAEEPEECIFGFFDCSSLLGRAVLRALPNYTGPYWDGDPDAAGTFREYRKMLQLLTWKSPAPKGGFLLLKSPQVSVGIQAFANEFPEAQFVLTHRDPFRAGVSRAAVFHAMNPPFMVDPPVPGDDAGGPQEVRRLLIGSLGPIFALARAHSERVANVRYADLMANAIATLNDVYHGLKRVPPSDMEDRVRGFLAEQRRGARAKPPSEFSNCGYDHDALLAEPLIAEYCEFFGVEKEGVRTTDTAT